MPAPQETGVRPFASRKDYEGMVDYFLGGSPAFLRGMGVDLAKVPTREEWLQAALADHDRIDKEKERFYVAWRYGGELVGHSSISHIEHGRTAHAHLHLWRTDLRGRGLGTTFMERSIDLYFERFELRTLASEPYAGNPAPNRALPALGFRQVKRFTTLPTGISFEQEVCRYELRREEWEVRRVSATRERASVQRPEGS